MHRSFRPVLLAGSIAWLCTFTLAQENFAPEEGHVFPEMSFPTLGGERLASLKDFRGEKVLLMQFASW